MRSHFLGRDEDLRETMFAAHGIEYISDSLEHQVACSRFVAVTDCVISSIKTPAASGNVTPDAVTGGVIIYGVAVPAGHTLPIPFSSITLTGGTGYGVKI